MEKKETTAFYSGVFDPFQRGHLNICVRTLRSYDRIVIAIEADNPKADTFSAEQRIEMVRLAIDDFIRVENKATEFKTAVAKRIRENPEIVNVIAVQGHCIDAAIACGADVWVRGVRNDTDKHIEDELWETTKVLLRTRNYTMHYEQVATNDNMNHMSSTVVKQLCNEREFIAALHYVTPQVHGFMMRHYLAAELLQLWPLYFMRNFPQLELRHYSRIGYILGRLQILKNTGCAVSDKMRARLCFGFLSGEPLPGSDDLAEILLSYLYDNENYWIYDRWVRKDGISPEDRRAELQELREKITKRELFREDLRELALGNIAALLAAK